MGNQRPGYSKPSILTLQASKRAMSSLRCTGPTQTGMRLSSDPRAEPICAVSPRFAARNLGVAEKRCEQGAGGGGRTAGAGDDLGLDRGKAACDRGGGAETIEEAVVDFRP